MGKEPERVLIFWLIYYTRLINSVSRPSSVFHTFLPVFSHKIDDRSTAY